RSRRSARCRCGYSRARARAPVARRRRGRTRCRSGSARRRRRGRARCWRRACRSRCRGRPAPRQGSSAAPSAVASPHAAVAPAVVAVKSAGPQRLVKSGHLPQGRPDYAASAGAEALQERSGVDPVTEGGGRTEYGSVAKYLLPSLRDLVEPQKLGNPCVACSPGEVRMTDRRPHIVVVEDEAAQRHLLVEYLSRHNFRVTGVDGGPLSPPLLSPS